MAFSKSPMRDHINGQSNLCEIEKRGGYEKIPFSLFPSGIPIN